MKSSSKLLYFKIITVIGSVVVSLYVAEIFLSFYFVIPTPLSNYYPWQAPKTSSTINTNQYEFKTVHKYNSQGFRDEEISFQKKSNEKRVLFVGDSMAEGYGVQVNERYSNIATTNLGNHYKGINVGQLATNPDNYFDNIINFGIGLKPDIIVMSFFVGNDFMGGRSYKIPTNYTVNYKIDKKFIERESSLKNFFRLRYSTTLINEALGSKANSDKLLKRFVSGNFWDLYYGFKMSKDFYLKTLKIDEKKFDKITASFNQKLLPYYFNGMIIPTLLIEGVKDKLPEYKQNEPFYQESDYKNTYWFLKESSKILTKNKIKFIVLVIPDMYQVEPEDFKRVLKSDFKMTNVPSRLIQLEDFRKRLVEDLRKDGVKYLDATDSLRNSKVMSYYLYDQHLNKEGHKIIGDELSKFIREDINQ